MVTKKRWFLTAFHSEAIESRIVGGGPAYIENHRYQVSLRTASNFHFCGGSIISNVRIILAKKIIQYLLIFMKFS